MTAPTAVIIPNPEPDLSQATRFLTWLDEEAEFFTFQTFDDLGSRKDPSLARILHGTLEQHQFDLRRLQWRMARGSRKAGRCPCRPAFPQPRTVRHSRRGKRSGGLQFCKESVVTVVSLFLSRCAVSGGDPSVSQRGRAA